MKLNNIACTQVHGPNLTVLPAYDSKPHDGDDPAGQNGARPEGARKIEQSIAYMMQHLDQPLQVANLAQSAHFSSSHFFALFKRWAGFSPIDYFIHLRMQRAGRLLAATTMSVKEIAAALGYDDPFYFSRVFKSVHGIAPSDYRLMMEELEQTGTHGGMPGSEKDGVLPPFPVSEQLGNNGGNGRTLHEKHNILCAAGGNYSIK
jgi:AraC-like DNA-binding protein